MELNDKEKYIQIAKVILPIAFYILFSMAFNLFVQVIAENETESVCFKSDLGLTIAGVKRKIS